MINYTTHTIKAIDGTEITISVPDLDTGGFTTEQLEAAFSLVQNPTNWKLPSGATVPVATLPLFTKAIEWYTGNHVSDGSLVVGEETDGQVQISFKGYYHSIGI